MYKLNWAGETVATNKDKQNEMKWNHIMLCTRVNYLTKYSTKNQKRTRGHTTGHRMEIVITESLRKWGNLNY